MHRSTTPSTNHIQLPAIGTRRLRVAHAFLAALWATLALLQGCSGGDGGATTQTPDSGPFSEVARITYPTGEIASDFPASIASGDFNGDGVTDLLLGAPLATPDVTRNQAGKAYVLFGPVSGELDVAGEADLVIVGAVASDNLGAGVAAGDLNGDGTSDIIVGAPNSNALANLRTDMGEAYVVFGRAGLAGTIDTLSEEQDATIQPAEGFSQLGRAFATGDVNGDGVDDLVAGAPYAGRQPDTPPGSPRTTVGEVYVVYGGEDLRGLITVMSNDEDVLISGARAYDQFGLSVAVYDVDDDGVGDVIVGAPGFSGAEGDRQAAGALFVFSGGPSLPERISLDEASVTLLGDANDSLGTIVAAGGQRIVASAPSAADREGQPGAGAVFIIDPATIATGDVARCGCTRRLDGAPPGTFFPASLAASSGDALMAFGAAEQVHVLQSAPGADISLGSAEVDLIAGTAGLGTAVVFADLDGDGQVELLAQSTGPGGSSVAAHSLTAPAD